MTAPDAGSPAVTRPPAVARPAPRPTAIAARLFMELRLTIRRGESVLVTVAIPAAVLLFFAAAPVVDGEPRPVESLLPGVLALAVIASGLVSLGIATAYERHYGVLKRLGASPLGRADLLVAKIGAVLVVELAQVALLVGLAVTMLGWTPPATASPALAAGALALGTVAFAGLGLLLAGALRAEATLALANALFLAFLLLGGIVRSVDALPAPLGQVATLLPAAALADLLRSALASGATAIDPGTAVLVLGAWAAGAVLLAARTFRWD